MLGEAIRLAWGVLVRTPVRSALTVLSLGIGVAAFLATVSFGRGARASALARFEAMGAHLVVVTTATGQYETKAVRVRPLTDRDVSTLQREAPSVSRVVPMHRSVAEARANGRVLPARVTGTTPAFFAVRRWTVALGGEIVDADVASAARVCVIGQTTATNLWDRVDVLGEVLELSGLRCRVIGVLERQGVALTGADNDDLVIVPATTAAAHLTTEPGYFRLLVEPVDRSAIRAAQAEVVSILRRTHDIAPGDDVDFQIARPDDARKSAEKVSGTMTALLAGIAAVSVLVGCIGIMNILFVSVTERTHEIGVRAAIGAAPDAILAQFLAEAAVLSIVGAGLGAVLGLGISLGVAGAMHWPAGLSPPDVLLAIVAAVLFGMLSGWIPARRASSLDPVLALRQE